jgi:addiction module RelE/StbE family toxin
MYEIVTKSRKAEKQYYEALQSNSTITEKLEKLKENPRGCLDAHKLKGKLFGLWGCSLGYDLRMVYKINDETKEIIVFSVGTHKMVYR